ncbi:MULTISPECIES: RidA family protein [Anaerostipes]|uniref:Reactive intermediate/imine deaminase n=1 Tax=Anaerostipes butyraticus TaxID=645466 RepID=A0A916Q4M7_9FIRM|nr:MULTISPECIES: RidA family protein [Anaerostipes]GFO84282.1 reactive intermediate/imine deaminase [Anaerostipes butyraticus]HJC83681.1 RidA family protein [Candidatus Anaerostipes avicola]
MEKKIINAENAPAAVGPYCHAVEAGNFVFTSGQIGLDPNTQELAEGIEAQTKQVLENLKAVLKAAGLTLSDVIKTTVFLDDVSDFGVVNEIYETYFNDSKPARSCVEAGALPKGALIEIEVIAAK